jgi:hypothetical protein
MSERASVCTYVMYIHTREGPVVLEWHTAATNHQHFER